MDYVILGLAQLARTRGSLLMDSAAAEERVWALSGQFPKLASSLLAKCPPQRFARLLRALLSSRVPIGELPTIAQAVLDAPHAPEELVRSRLAHTATLRLGARTSTIVSYLLEEEAERRLSAAAPDSSTYMEGSIADELAAGVARELALLPPAAMVPCVLTHDPARRAAAAALRLSDPDMIVASYGELPGWADVYPVARVSLEPPALEL
jgi:flagellar biosynthesis component FlhA